VQVFNEVSSREMERINVFEGILDNNVFATVLSSTIVFQFIIVEYLGSFANTTPLTFTQWIASIFIGFIGMPIAAAVKMVPVDSV
jgi:Ca2+-transporting ATPase